MGALTEVWHELGRLCRRGPDSSKAGSLLLSFLEAYEIVLLLSFLRGF